MTHTQLTLPFSVRTESAFRQHLEERLNKPVSLVLTDNATTMLSFRKKDAALFIRLHRLFLNADLPVIDEIASFVRDRKGAMPRFREFLRLHRESLAAKPARKRSLRAKGRHHDLQDLYDRINSEYFGNSITAGITWGSRSPRSAVRKRTVGSYSERSKVIRINPVLDRKTVPRFYVGFIVYHEMLHAALGTPMQGKRRIVHSREFRERERLFQDYDRAMAWERGDRKTNSA
ncbi:MAG: hypothetical protein M0042_13350 [Nitrospiraceae bacterium]|nr:hypothetical protein [Nitrospiraceae bacterium]